MKSLLFLLVLALLTENVSYAETKDTKGDCSPITGNVGRDQIINCGASREEIQRLKDEIVLEVKQKTLDPELARKLEAALEYIQKKNVNDDSTYAILKYASAAIVGAGAVHYYHRRNLASLDVNGDIALRTKVETIVADIQANKDKPAAQLLEPAKNWVTRDDRPGYESLVDHGPNGRFVDNSILNRKAHQWDSQESEIARGLSKPADGSASEGPHLQAKGRHAVAEPVHGGGAAAIVLALAMFLFSESPTELKIFAFSAVGIVMLLYFLPRLDLRGLGYRLGQLTARKLRRKRQQHDSRVADR